ncbi:MAG TPA: ChbG/HpnK family deacetylase [Candidatus Saccharibacteria bacterium]|nr:ChbG/HpnK family deacetylase [Candidatus Saccharibacteria bacterium]
MLIINADDLGRNRESTDRILACYKARRLTSTSAMVFMEDSERAARLAASAGIGVGLHINFSETFTQAGTPATIHLPHERVVRFLRRHKCALLIYNPFLAKSFRDSFRHQNDEFLRLFGRPPSHYDGHQHMHLATNMLFQRIIPEKARVRRSFTFYEGEKSWLNRAYRRAVDKKLVAGNQTTDCFFSLAHYMQPDRLSSIVKLAASKSVELMVHPHLENEFNFILSEGFAKCIRPAKLCRYDEL